MFLRLDEDGSGCVSREEIEGIIESDRQMLQDTLCISNPTEIFDALDVDGSGSLEIDEFCDGIWQVATSKAPIEIKRIEKQVHILREQGKDSARIQASTWRAVETMHRVFEEDVRRQRKVLSRESSGTPPGFSEGMSSGVRHPGRMVVSSGPVTFAPIAPSVLNAPSAPLSPGERLSGLTSNACLTDMQCRVDPTDEPAWVEALTLRLQRSLREAAQEAVGAASSTSLPDTFEPLLLAMAVSMQKLMAALERLSKPISSLQAVSALKPHAASVLHRAALNQLETDDGVADASLAGSRDLRGAASFEQHARAISVDYEDAQPFFAALEALDQLELGQAACESALALDSPGADNADGVPDSALVSMAGT